MDDIDMVAQNDMKIEADGAQSASDKVFRFRRRPDPATETPPLGERRDWNAAIDLIHEASEAVRLAEERAQAAEDYSTQLAAFHQDQQKAAEQRIAQAEKRAEAALLRATEAEAWLTRFHDAIVDGFGQRTKEPTAARS